MKKRSKTTLDSDSAQITNALDSDTVNPAETTTLDSTVTKAEEAKPLDSEKTKPSTVKKRTISSQDNDVVQPAEVKKPDPDLQKIAEARHHDPFSILGRHQKGDRIEITVYLPYAETVSLSNKGSVLNRIPNTDFFSFSAGISELPNIIN